MSHCVQALGCSESATKTRSYGQNIKLYNSGPWTAKSLLLVVFLSLLPTCLIYSEHPFNAAAQAVESLLTYSWLIILALLTSKRRLGTVYSEGPEIFQWFLSPVCPLEKWAWVTNLGFVCTCVKWKWFVQPKVILLLTVVLEYLKLLINTAGKSVSLLASLVFPQCRNLPSPSHTEINWALHD